MSQRVGDEHLPVLRAVTLTLPAEGTFWGPNGEYALPIQVEVEIALVGEHGNHEGPVITGVRRVG